MCGIAGIIDFAGRPVLQEELQRMTDAIAHRGPDGEGFFVDGAVGFGHRRLSIIDLSNAAAQPMTRFGLTITYNGEIYNYIELRQALEKQGIAFTTQSDTEVILAAYHCWGKDCVQRFNGMWAFAIYDASNREVVLSRDRFGEKPLYYTEQQGRLLFCSEIKGLLPLLPEVTPDPVSVAFFLLHERAEFSSRTFFNRIHTLPAGHSCSIELLTGKKMLWRYYTPQATTAYEGLSAEEIQQVFTTELTSSISMRLRSDVQVGSCLSGGLDSSAIVSVAALLYQQQTGSPFQVLSAGAITPAVDELGFARKVAMHCGVQQHCLQPAASMLQRALQPVHFAQESPLHSASPLLQWLLFEAAASQGLKVMLDGQGADELCMGYQTHLAWALARQPYRAGMGKLLPVSGRYGVSTSQMLKLLALGIWPHWKIQQQQSRWPRLHAQVAEAMAHETFGIGKTTTLLEMQVAELTEGTLPLLLRYEDKNAMAHGVETRLPFLDAGMASFLLSLPIQHKVQDGWSKYIIRKFVSRQLPDELAWRKGKIGFEPGDFSIGEIPTSPGLSSFFAGQVFQKPATVEVPTHPAAVWRWKSLQLWYATFFE